MDFDFNSIYKISVTAMRINRSHPDIPRDMKWLLQFIVMHGIFTFIFSLIMYSTMFHDLKNKDFTQACENSIISVLYIVVTFCYGMMLWSQESLMFLINKVHEDYSVAKNLPVAEQTMLLKYAKRGNWNIRMWLCITGVVCLTFPVRSISLMVYYTIENEFQLVPMYEVTYPAILEKSRDNLVSFALIYAGMLWYCSYAASMYVGLIPLGPIFLLHTCGQLQLVINKSKTLFVEHSYNSKETEEKLKGIAKHLQDIYCFAEHIQASFKLIYELCLKGTIVTMPLLIYGLIETTKMGTFNLEFFALTLGCIVIAGNPCHYSDLLMEQSNSVRQGLYCGGWERHWDKRVRRMLLIILIRTVRPVAIRTLFDIVCLGALTQVFHHSYAIFNLINAAW